MKWVWSACRQLLRGASCRGPPTTPGSDAKPNSSQQPLRSASLTLPPALQEELLQADPELAPEAAADIIERNLPRHTLFEPRTDLMPRPVSVDGSAAGSSCGGGGARGSEGGASAAASAATKALAALPRQTPPEPRRVSRERFDEMEAQGEFIAVQGVLFRHERARCRVGAVLYAEEGAAPDSAECYRCGGGWWASA